MSGHLNQASSCHIPATHKKKRIKPSTVLSHHSDSIIIEVRTTLHHNFSQVNTVCKYILQSASGHASEIDIKLGHSEVVCVQDRLIDQQIPLMC